MRQQALQRQRSREALLNSAAKLFAEKPYLQVTVDDIIRSAGVSRATFYQHFANKLDVATSVTEAGESYWWPLVLRLAEISPEDLDRLEAWLREFAEPAEEQLGRTWFLFEQIELFESEFHARMRATRHRMIGALGERIATLRPVLGDGETARRIRARAYFLLMRIRTYCAEVNLHGPLEDADVYLRLLAEEVSEFLKQPLRG